MHIFFFSVLRMRTVYNIEIPMILRIIGIFLFIWFDGLPGGTRPTGLRQQPVLRLFCCFGGICRPPVSIFEAFRPKRYYFMHNYPFFDILSLQARKKTAARSFQTVDKSHECHKMFVASSILIFKEIVEIPTLEMIFMV